MKKIIAILAMVALVGGVAFAEASVSGAVIGTVNVLQNGVNEKGDDIVTGSAGLDRVRLEASGGDEDGKFGAWLRIEGASFNFDEIFRDSEEEGEEGPNFDNIFKNGFAGNVWWKPIDQLLIRIGSNGGDGYYEKAGVTTWMFYQTASDTGVVDPGNAWWSTYTGGFHFRNAFYSGFGDNALMLEIKPVEMIGFNVVLPYFNAGEVKDIFGNLVLQADVNLDFGNIALTYTGDSSDDTNGNVYLYLGLGIGDNVALDIGLGLTIPGDVEGQKLNVGLGAKVGISEAFGLKLRLVAGIPTDSDDKVTNVLFDVLPFFALSDSATVFVSLGLALVDKDGDAWVGFHFNPYLQVGSEWGPKFLAGIKVSQNLAYDGKFADGGDAKINWSVPIAISVGF